MQLGELLVKEGLVTEEQLELGIERQKIIGGLLGDNLCALGFVDPGDLRRVLQEPPQAPKTPEETGLDIQFLTNLLLKFIYILGLQSSNEIAGQIKFPQCVVESLLSILRKQGLVELIGATSTNFPVMKYALTTAGKSRAVEASMQSGYVGPAPVPLSAFLDRIERQSITHERIDVGTLKRRFSHLVLPEHVVRRLGPAVNSGKALLLYGPPGNGKTSICEAVGRAFSQSIFIPHCIEVDRQVIRIFDPTVHVEMPQAAQVEESLLSRPIDARWVLCRRPVIISGGELTLAMLDLDWDPISKFYEAPPQVKAIGGVFIIDDFGRQLVQPRDLLNRWIIPLEKKIDYLTIHTGKKFEVPFDELIIFSTNIPPEDLMDAALLRRVQYKLRLDPPDRRNYLKIFQDVCRTRKLDLPEDVLGYLLDEFYPAVGAPLAAFHPKFIVDHVIATCNFEGKHPTITLDLVTDAMSNLIVAKGVALGLTEAEDSLSSICGRQSD